MELVSYMKLRLKFRVPMRVNLVSIVCVSINQELCYSSLIYGPTAFASPPISKKTKAQPMLTRRQELGGMIRV